MIETSTQELINAIFLDLETLKKDQDNFKVFIESQINSPVEKLPKYRIGDKVFLSLDKRLYVITKVVFMTYGYSYSIKSLEEDQIVIDAIGETYLSEDETI